MEKKLEMKRLAGVRGEGQGSRSYPGENNGQRSESLQKSKNGPVLLLLFLLKESSVSTSAPHQHQKTTSGAKLKKTCTPTNAPGKRIMCCCFIKADLLLG